MKNSSIVVVEDDAAIRRVIVITLKTAGYSNIFEAETGDEGLDAIRMIRPQLVLLDRMLPGMDGLDICKYVRNDEAIAETPIIMLTAKSEEHDIVQGLDAGANDYITKPFSREILLARIRALLRRPGEDNTRSVEFAGIVIDPYTHTVNINGEPLELTLSEYKILDLLVRNKNRVFTRSSIIDRISDGQKIVTDRTIDVQILGLRRKLGVWAEHLKTVRGVGYRVS